MRTTSPKTAASFGVPACASFESGYRTWSNGEKLSGVE
jgi:hypothetical protein